MKYLRFERGTVLIVATITVVLMSAISASLVLQIRADSSYTQLVKNQNIVESLLKGAVHESIRTLNLTPPPNRSGNVGVTTWTRDPASFDVGMDGVAGTNDEGEGDGYPSFALPGDSRPGEPGGVWRVISVTDGSGQIFEARYAVFDENLGTNGFDDNNDDPGDFSKTDDDFEAAFHRLYAVAFYGNAIKKANVLIGATNAEETRMVSEAFFKAIYAGNSSEDPNYYLDMGGQGKTGDSVKGDVFITGNIRLSNASFMWKKEDYTDTNGNGVYDFGEPVNDVNGQEPGFLNFGTEATGDVNLRSNIGTSWATKDPTIAGSPAFYNPGAQALDTPDFTKSLEAVTVNVSDEINAKGTNYTLVQSGSANVRGIAVQNVNDPAHLFMKANANQLANLQDYYHPGYVNNGLDNYVLKDTTTSNVSKLFVPPSGNNQVYYIEGNLLFGMDGAVEMYFVPTANTSDPLRVTFLVQGNIVINDDFVYRNSSGQSIGSSHWNPYDDAFALVALKHEDAPDNSGNIQFADLGSHTFTRMDGYLYAENDFVSNHGLTHPNITINGMMAAGNHVRINQEFVNGAWRARPDSSRTRFIVNFDTRIRSLVNDANWLPGLPGGSNRSMPVASNPDDFFYDQILAWN